MTTSASASADSRLFDWIAIALRWSLIVSLVVMMAAITIQVVGRYVFLRAPTWSEELAVLCFSWATLGGLALGVREGFHVALTLLIEALPVAAQRLWQRLISFATVCLGAYVVYSGLRFFDATSGTVSAAMEYPIEILNAMAPVAGALVLLFAIERIIWPLAPGSST